MGTSNIRGKRVDRLYNLRRIQNGQKLQALPLSHHPKIPGNYGLGSVAGIVLQHKPTNVYSKVSPTMFSEAYIINVYINQCVALVIPSHLLIELKFLGEFAGEKDNLGGVVVWEVKMDLPGLCSNPTQPQSFMCDLWPTTISHHHLPHRIVVRSIEGEELCAPPCGP